MLLIGVMLCLTGSARAQFPPYWSVKSTFTGTVSPTSQMRSLRGLSLSADETKLYAGFIQGSGSSGMRKIDVATGATDTQLTIGRAITSTETDDRGLVYAATGAEVRIYDSNLTAASATITLSGAQVNGLSLRKTGSTYQLYVARASNAIERYNVTNTGAVAIDTTFGTNGVFTVADPNLGTNPSTSAALRGLEVDSDGTIFVADRELNRVFRISADLGTTTSVAATRAMDVAIFADEIFVTSYNGPSSNIPVYDKSLKQTATFIVPSNEVPTHVDNGGDSGFAGIDINSLGELYVVDQVYSNDSSGITDRILVSTPIPEPTCFATVACGGVLLLRRSRQR
jgi:hypothetical protein